MKKTPEEKRAQLVADYEEFKREAARMESEGKPIGTFSSWRFENKPSIKIAMTREEFFGKNNL